MRQVLLKLPSTIADRKDREDPDMDIYIGPTEATILDPSEEGQRGVPVVKKTSKRDRRKNRQDRRKSVRDGVYVTLSSKKNRRSGTDRRKN